LNPKSEADPQERTEGTETKPFTLFGGANAFVQGELNKSSSLRYLCCLLLNPISEFGLNACESSTQPRSIAWFANRPLPFFHPTCHRRFHSQVGWHPNERRREIVALVEKEEGVQK
jgi:hypothetical protein